METTNQATAPVVAAVPTIGIFKRGSMTRDGDNDYSVELCIDGASTTPEVAQFLKRVIDMGGFAETFSNAPHRNYNVVIDPPNSEMGIGFGLILPQCHSWSAARGRTIGFLAFLNDELQSMDPDDLAVHWEMTLNPPDLGEYHKRCATIKRESREAALGAIKPFSASILG